MKKIFLGLIIIVLIFAVNTNIVFAGFADLTDEQADKQALEQKKEQEKEHNVTEVKSSDNFLTSLQVEGYTLTPDFDKQTLEYTIKEEINKKEINIKATTSNEKATLNGTGKIKIDNNKKEYRIDVTAENGAVRTYVIKLSSVNSDKQNENEKNESEQEQNIETAIAVEHAEDIEESTTANETKETNNNLVYVLLGIGVVLFVGIIASVSKNKKTKRRRKH